MSFIYFMFVSIFFLVWKVQDSVVSFQVKVRPVHLICFIQFRLRSFLRASLLRRHPFKTHLSDQSSPPLGEISLPAGEWDNKSWRRPATPPVIIASSSPDVHRAKEQCVLMIVSFCHGQGRGRERGYCVLNDTSHPVPGVSKPWLKTCIVGCFGKFPNDFFKIRKSFKNKLIWAFY